MSETAVILANGHLQSLRAKTTHGLVRGPSRYRILGVVDPDCAGQDAGVVVDGRHREIPVAAALTDLLGSRGQRPDYCLVGVATEGGMLPESLRSDLVAAANLGISLVNGLHQLLCEDAEIRAAAEAGDARILDLRRPRPIKDLRFWTGEVAALTTPRIAVLGTDCAMGKRTTCNLLQAACNAQGLRSEVIYTGQTGWLQGHRHGFILDATANDFVSGELEGAVLDCVAATDPDLMLLEGQSALRNPSGPSGSEFILSAGAGGVILQHAPARSCYVGFENSTWKIPPLAEDIELIRLLGAEVLALCVNEQDLKLEQAQEMRDRLAAEHGLPTFLPLGEDLADLVEVIRQWMGKT